MALDFAANVGKANAKQIAINSVFMIINYLMLGIRDFVAASGYDDSMGNMLSGFESDTAFVFSPLSICEASNVLHC